MTGAPYSYALGNPLNGDAPSGLFCLSASCLIQDAAAGAAAVGVVPAVVVLAPEVAVGAVVTVSVEEATAVVLTDAGAVAVATTTVETTAIISATLATQVATASTYVAFAAGPAKVADTCLGGRSPECLSAFEEAATSFSFAGIGRFLDSPVYEFANALREFEGAPSGRAGPTCS